MRPFISYPPTRLSLRMFLACGLAGMSHHSLSAQSIILESQEWNYSHGQLFGTTQFQDTYEKQDFQESEEQLFSMSFGETYSGELEGFSTAQGVLITDYEGVYQDLLVTEVQSNGDYESMLSIEYTSSWDLFLFSTDESAFMTSDSRLDGSIYFSVPEETLCVLQVTLNVDAFSSSAEVATVLRASVGISGDGLYTELELELPVDISGELVASREISLDAGDYAGDVSLDLFYSDNGGGVMFAEGASACTVTLFGRALSAPELPIRLSVAPGDEPDSLHFSATNLEIGKYYELIASPDLSFTDTSVVTSLERKVLFPETTVSIGSMGPQQFFRLVELED